MSEPPKAFAYTAEDYRGQLYSLRLVLSRLQASQNTLRAMGMRGTDRMLMEPINRVNHAIEAVQRSLEDLNKTTEE